MKKQYNKPSMSEVILGSTQMLCGSIWSAIGIGYGGVDDGTSGRDPASRSHKYNNWDEDDEEDEE